jgi:two-component system sensor histidine kinase RegB
MAVVIRELELNHGGNAELQEDLLLLREQVDRCKQTISQILASTGQGRGESLRSLALDAYLQRLLDDWQVIRPHARISVSLQGVQPAPLIAAERTLEQALLNLLDNAADANGENREALQFSPPGTPSIVDRNPRPGAGLDEETAQRLGEAFFSTKTATRDPPNGIGIGLFLSNATVERLGGKVELFNRADPQGGACTRVTLPLTRLKA